MSKRQQKRLRELIRQFKENGIKMMLEHPANVRELLQIVADDRVERIDFERLQWVKTTFIRRDFRHAESDVVLVAPLRRPGGGRSRKRLLIYILIEHQSKPDRLMPLRMVDYMVQIFNYQLRQWSRTHRSLDKVRLAPVLPIVLYTGTRRWPMIGTILDLFDHGSEFRAITPILARPFFFNLPRVTARALKKGRYFGSVLWLIQQRRAKLSDFRDLLRQVVAHLESMPAEERLRWLDLVSYIHAMVYHERNPNEIRPLQAVIEASAATDEHRQEITHMAKSYAEVLIEEGIEKGIEKGELQSKQSTLHTLLRVRFGSVPATIEDAIDATNDINQLDTWLERFATAQTLDEVGIQP